MVTFNISSPFTNVWTFWKLVNLLSVSISGNFLFLTFDVSLLFCNLLPTLHSCTQFADRQEHYRHKTKQYYQHIKQLNKSHQWYLPSHWYTRWIVWIIKGPRLSLGYTNIHRFMFNTFDNELTELWKVKCNDQQGRVFFFFLFCFLFFVLFCFVLFCFCFLNVLQ